MNHVFVNDPRQLAQLLARIAPRAPALSAEQAQRARSALVVGSLASPTAVTLWALYDPLEVDPPMVRMVLNVADQLVDEKSLNPAYWS